MLNGRSGFTNGQPNGQPTTSGAARRTWVLMGASSGQNALESPEAADLKVASRWVIADTVEEWNGPHCTLGQSCHHLIIPDIRTRRGLSSKHTQPTGMKVAVPEQGARCAVRSCSVLA